MLHKKLILLVVLYLQCSLGVSQEGAYDVLNSSASQSDLVLGSVWQTSSIIECVYPQKPIIPIAYKGNELNNNFNKEYASAKKWIDQIQEFLICNDKKAEEKIKALKEGELLVTVGSKQDYISHVNAARDATYNKAFDDRDKYVEELNQQVRIYNQKDPYLSSNKESFFKDKSSHEQSKILTIERDKIISNDGYGNINKEYFNKDQLVIYENANLVIYHSDKNHIKFIKHKFYRGQNDKKLITEKRLTKHLIRLKKAFYNVEDSILNIDNSDLKQKEKRKKALGKKVKELNKLLSKYDGRFSFNPSDALITRANQLEAEARINLANLIKKREYDESLIPFSFISDLTPINIFLDNKLLQKNDKRIISKKVKNIDFTEIKLEPRPYSIKLTYKNYEILDAIDPVKDSQYHPNWGKEFSEEYLSIATILSNTSDELLNLELDESPKNIDDSKYHNPLKSDLNGQVISNYKKINQHIENQESFITDLNMFLTHEKYSEHFKNDSSNNQLLSELEANNKKLNNKISYSSINSIVRDSSNLGMMIDRIDDFDEIADPYEDFTQNILFVDSDIDEINLIKLSQAKTIKMENTEFTEELIDIESKPIILYLNLIEDEISQNVTKKTDKKGKVKVGTEQRLNPQYDVIKAQRDAEAERYYAARVAYELDDTCSYADDFWKALACAALTAPSSAKLDRLEKSLQATPRFTNHSIYQEYPYIQSDVFARRSLKFTIGVVDTKNMTFHESIETLEFSKNFKINTGVEEKDVNYNQIKRMSSGPDEIDKFLKKKERIRLKNLIEKIENKDFSAGKKIEVDFASFMNNIFQPLKQEANDNVLYAENEDLIIDDPRFESVVKIETFEGQGSGFYVSHDLIITNAHVVENQLIVNISNRKSEEFTGRVIKFDSNIDLALIKVNKKVKPVKFWNDEPIKIGEGVLAIGHPKGFEFTVTKGILSQQREFGDLETGLGRKYKYLQVDVPINPGNSGGPLYLNDKVIGVNTFKLNNSEGMNFAIHFHEVLEFIQSGS